MMTQHLNLAINLLPNNPELRMNARGKVVIDESRNGMADND